MLFGRKNGLTCKLLLAAISDAGLQVLQLYLDLFVVSHGLFTLPPVDNQHRQQNRG